MKTFSLLVLFFLLFSLAHSQSSEHKEINGYYERVTEQTYFVIDNDKIVRIDFCYFCESTVQIDATSYTFINDTLTFNLGKFYSSDNYFDNRWVYYDSVRFLDVEFGEYHKISRESINAKLKEFGIMLIENNQMD